MSDLYIVTAELDRRVAVRDANLRIATELPGSEVVKYKLSSRLALGMPSETNICSRSLWTDLRPASIRAAVKKIFPDTNSNSQMSKLLLSLSISRQSYFQIR